MEDLRRRLEEVLARPVRSASDAERAAEAAEALAGYIRASERAEQVLGGEDKKQVGTGSLAGVTLEEAAERVLEQAGTPLHVRELGKRIKAGGWQHPRSTNARSDQIEYQLAARLPRQRQRFRRVAPNTFALAKWAHENLGQRRRPSVGLFAGSGEGVGRAIGESPEIAAGASRWRSS